MGAASSFETESNVLNSSSHQPVDWELLAFELKCKSLVFRVVDPENTKRQVLPKVPPIDFLGYAGG